ncbi:FAD-dependent oxidoreductase [Candidatus Saccharibacteria bacterium]|nr:FAD-dependent oxidoreductase [Candidatus Saccharibacteria bacterium]
MKQVVVVGANFAGATAALEIKRRMKNKVAVTVIDRKEHSLYFPSLIWVPIGRREVDQVLVPRRPVFDKRGVKFVVDTAVSVDPDAQEVVTENSGAFPYDELVIATGPRVNRDIAPGVREHACYVGSVDGALDMRKKLEEFKQDPGPIVVGATQKASCMGAAYEFLFNVEKWLREQKIRKKVDLYWITPETYLGHFGIDGMLLAEPYLKSFMKMFNIHYRTEVGVKEVTKESVVLDTDEVIPSKFTMLMVPFTGVDLIAKSPKLEAPENLFLDVKPSYQHKKYDNVWGAGLAVDVKPSFTPGRVPFGVPKTGYPSDSTGKIVAKNVVKALRGKSNFVEKPWGKIPALCVMDAGHKEVIILGNSLFKPRWFAIMVPNVLNDWSKLMLEKYFLWKLRHGYSWMP